MVNSMNRSQNRTASRSILSPTTAPSHTVKKSSTSSGNHVASGVDASAAGGGWLSCAARFAAFATFFCKYRQCFSSCALFLSSTNKRPLDRFDHSGSDTSGNAAARTISSSRLENARTKNTKCAVFSGRLKRFSDLTRITRLKKPANFSGASRNGVQAETPSLNFSFTIITTDITCVAEALSASKCGHRYFSRYWEISNSCTRCRFGEREPPPSSSA
mmetsp:Transcript_906/g.3583  ORF Transcript_906/g.3583 Transcript_906/m.3583 type:complete len:217 (-) Transcript_906:564-1214(-)